jgi:hypothetical protein
MDLIQLSPPSGPQPVGNNGPQGNLYDSGTPRVPARPAPQIPLNNGADDDDTPDALDAMAQGFLAHLIRKDALASGLVQPAPPQQNNPTQNSNGSFGQKLASAISSAGNTLATNLGDAAAATGHGGWLSGIERTLAARNSREAREAQVQFENNERLKNDQINLAVANANLRQHALAIYQQEKAIRDASYTDGSKFIDSLRDQFNVRDDISGDQLQQVIKNDPSYLQTHTARIVGETPVYDSNGQQKIDRDGNPIYEPKYSIVDLAPGDASKLVTLSAEEAKKLIDAGVGTFQAGTKIPPTVLNRIDVQADRYNATLGMLDKARVNPLPAEVKEQLVTTMQNPEVQHAVAMGDSAIDGLYTAMRNADQHIAVAQKALDAAQKAGDQNAVQAVQQQLQTLRDTRGKLDQVVTQGFTDQDRAAYFKEQEQKSKDAEQARRDAEKERHDQRLEDLQTRREDILAQKQQQDMKLGDSYKVENKELDTVAKPLQTQLDSFSTLRAALDQGTAAGDSVVAPALLKALVAGGGVRITQAEINNFTHGRSTVEDMRGILQKMSSGKSITPEQRAQVYSLLGAVEAKAQAKNQALQDAQDQLDSASDITTQRKAVSDLKKKLGTIDAGSTQTTQPPAGAVGHAQLPNGTTVYQMKDGSIQDKAGNKYDAQGNRL